MQKITSQKNKKGFVILFAITISSILLAVALGVANIAFKEIKFSTSSRNANDAFFAADTGVECALQNDKSTSDIFTSDSSATTMNCVNSAISLSKTVSAQTTWDFVVPSLGSSGQACAKVQVVKDFSDPLNILSTITSKGYNSGDSSCASSDTNRTERQLEVSYDEIGTIAQPIPDWIFQRYVGGTYIDLVYDSADGYWTPDGNSQGPPTEWVAASSSDVHPGGGTYGDVALSMTVPNDGNVDITVTASDANPSCGDGVQILVDKNSTNLSTDSYSNGFPEDVIVNSVAVSADDLIHVRVNRKSANDCDGTNLSAQVVYSGSGPTTYVLDVSPTGTGSGTVTSDVGAINCGATCSDNYSDGTVVTLTATPNSGSNFAGWSGGGCSGTGSCVVTMSSDLNVTATFNAIVSTISFVGASSNAGTTVTSMPAHQAGDLLVIFAYRDGSTTAPSLPAGWTNVGTANGANANSSRIGYRVAPGSGTSSGTWTNATELSVQVFRGQNVSTPIGANGNTGASSSTVTYPSLFLSQTNGTSWIAGFAGHVSVNTALENAPSGMTNKTSFVNATAEIVGHNTDAGVSSWNNQNVVVGGTSGGWRARTLEIISQ